MEKYSPIKEIKFSHKENIGLYGSLILDNGIGLEWELIEKDLEDTCPSHNNNWREVVVYEEFENGMWCEDIDDADILAALQKCLEDHNYYRDQW